jgi:D-aminopeptidase
MKNLATHVPRIVCRMPLVFAAIVASTCYLTTMTAHAADQLVAKPRARAYGVAPGVFRSGPLNAITDVAGVKVGQTTLIEGDNVRTGVTAILPHGGNLFQDKVPAGFIAGNAFGKFAGSTQIDELGELETPVILTNTLSVAEGIAATVEWTLSAKGNEAVRSVNAVVGETNDGFLNAIRLRRVTKKDVLQSIEVAKTGPVAEGSVGAGTGTQAFGWKGGIGTSSRLLPKKLGGYTVGVLVQTNYGGVLSVDGAPVGKKLGQYLLKEAEDQYSADGSIVAVIATDAPLSDRNLKRLARRAFQGIGATGSPMSNGSGEYAMAFSTALSVRRTPERRADAGQFEELPNDKVTPLFQAAMEATQEAVYNAMVAATTMTGSEGHTLNGLPIDDLKAILAAHGIKAAK